MSNVFDFNRFGKYLGYDLRNLWSRFGINLLVLGLFPLIYYIFWLLFSTFAPTNDMSAPSLTFRAIAFWIPLIALLVACPAKVYGSLTERHSGSEWLLVPASRLEKFLSMMLVCLVVVPISYLLIYTLSDGLICLLDPACGEPLLRFDLNTYLIEGSDGVVSLVGRGFWLLWSSMVQTILIFLLGALCFRKGKVAKTVLVLMGLGILTSLLGTVLVGMRFADPEEILQRMQWCLENPDFLVNLFLNLRLLIVGGGLALAIWFRLKSLKH